MADDVVRARRIEIVDDQGRVVVTLGSLGEGQETVFGLQVREPYGRARADLTVDGFSSDMTLGSRGEIAAVVSVDETGTAHLHLNDRQV